MTQQRFSIQKTEWEANSDEHTPVFLASDQLYSVTTIGGGIHAFGAEHIRGKMGGVWAHPIRVLDGWTWAVQQQDMLQQLSHASSCVLDGSHIMRHYSFGDLQITWTEFVAEGSATLISLVRLHNTGTQPWKGQLVLQAACDMRGCWFGGWETTMPRLSIHNNALCITGESAAYIGRAASIMLANPCSWQLEQQQAYASLPISLSGSETAEHRAALTVVHTGGVEAACASAQILLAQADQLLQDKLACYADACSVQLETPDENINQAWQVAQLNFQVLQASYPDLPRYFLAGIPEYPQLFGCDNEYTTVGAIAAGFADTMRSTLLALAAYGRQACARIPHEITTNGRVFHPGNTQETPQFASACWAYVRWTGDMEFLDDVYALCVEGLEHQLGVFEHDHYPTGDGVVERLGMGPMKLDSVCYLYDSLIALGGMSEAVGKHQEATHYQQLAEQLRERFERDWWIEAEGMYADSMHLDTRPQFDGHWTAVLPVQLGLAAPERAERVLERIELEFINEWGLIHTLNTEARVWTLPTGLLCLSAFEHQRPELAIEMLNNIALTAKHGSLGLLKELIPIGLCFVQLWSAGLLAEGLIAGALGLKPNMQLSQIDIYPQFPQEWDAMHIRNLRLGKHSLDIHCTHTELRIHHHSGPAALSVRFCNTEAITIPVGQDMSIAR